MRRPVTPSEDVWVRWFYLAHKIAVALGLLVIGGVLIAGQGSVGQRITESVLALALGWWTWWWVFRRQDDFFQSTWAPFVFLAVALPAYVGLGVLDSTFQIFLFLAYWQVFSLLALGWSIITATLLTIVNLWAQQGFHRSWPIETSQGWALLLGVLFMSALMAVFITSIVHQSNQRQALVMELESTRVQLSASERAAGVMQERQRLAGEMHDTIAQDFTSVVMHLEAAETHLDGQSFAAEHVATAKHAARTGLAESRRIVYALRPDLLTGASLDTALHTQVLRWARETGLKATFALEGDSLSLRRDVEVAVFRALQESLANVHRHATATEVHVTMTYLGDSAMLDVRDNGRGFALNQPGAGVGLATMQERIAQVGGLVIVESAIGEGTTVTLSIPVANEETA